MNGIQIEKIKEMISEASSKIALLKRELSDKNEQIEELNNINSQLMSEKESALKENEQLKNRLEQNEIEYNEVSEHNKKAVTEIETYLADLESMISTKEQNDSMEEESSEEVIAEEEIVEQQTFDTSTSDDSSQSDEEELNNLEDQLANLKMEMNS
jgi:chromosome segregation ATPase